MKPRKKTQKIQEVKRKEGNLLRGKAKFFSRMPLKRRRHEHHSIKVFGKRLVLGKKTAREPNRGSLKAIS